jgi:hypothetical protein
MVLSELSALADPISFKWTGSGTGFVYTDPTTPVITMYWGMKDSSAAGGFDPSSFTITASGDTSTRGLCITGTSCFSINNISASITVANVFAAGTDTPLGGKTFTLITQTRTFMNNDNHVVGFSEGGVNGEDLFIGPTGLPFWNMLTSFGPVSGSASFGDWSNSAGNGNVGGFSGILSDSGFLFFRPGSTAATFQAALTTTTPTVPEPNSIWLVGSGLAGILLISRRRFRTSRSRGTAGTE